MAALSLAISAQAPEEPSAYTVSARSISGAPFTTTSYRLGPLVVVDYAGNPSEGGDPSQGTHRRMLLNLDTKIRLTWDRVDANVPCVRSNFTADDRHGDDLEDLFIGGNGLASKTARQLGTETILGIATRILETKDSPDAALRMWVDPRTGLVLKAALASSAGGFQRTLWEVTHVNFEPPPASLFVVPPQCNPFPILPQTAPAPEEGSPESSGSLGEYAWNGLVGPATKESCTMLFRVVGPDAPKPLTSGIQVAVDLGAATEPSAHYAARLDEQGHATISGGQLHEIVPEGSGGIYRIDNVPNEFVIDVEFGWNGSAAARIYRHCFAPRTVLEFSTSPDAIHMGGMWEWVKPGMYPNDPY